MIIINNEDTNYTQRTNEQITNTSYIHLDLTSISTTNNTVIFTYETNNEIKEQIRKNGFKILNEKKKKKHLNQKFLFKNVLKESKNRRF